MSSAEAEYVALSASCAQYSRTKHIHTRYHFTKEQVENGIIELYFVKTEYQLADMFTKALPDDQFKYLVRRIGMRCLTPEELEGVLVLSGLSRVWKNHFCDTVLRGADGNFMGIHDFLCLPKWTGAKFQEKPYLDVRPTLQRLPFYCTPPAATDAVIPEPTPKDLATGTPSPKIIAKAEAFQNTTGPSLFAGDDDESDDDDACVEIPLVTPLCSVVVIPSSGNQGRSFIAPTAKGSNTRDSRGKGIMIDDDAAPSGGVS
ncbi:hypothetical protein Tco_1036815 [Tanacetum coccineum]